MTGANHGQVMVLRDYLHVVRRQKWVILAAVVLVPAAAIAFSLHQTKLYQANATVLLNAQNLASQLSGVSQTAGVSEPQTEVVQTQAEVARAPAVAAQVLHWVKGTGLTEGQFFAASSVSASTTADLLYFTVTNPSPTRAQDLVNAYAAAYTRYRHQLDTASIKRALQALKVRIGKLEADGQQNGALYAALVERQQTLQTMQTLETSNASVIKPAGSAAQTQPKTSRNAILGLVLGLVLGLGLAFLRTSLDTRIRSAQEIGEALGHVPLLARVPSPPRRLAKQQSLAMVKEPYGPYAETFRVLRTNLEFVSLGHHVRTVMMTSAIHEEGKSTTIANLAVALARAGKHVALVDLDLRRPNLNRFFDLRGPGVTQVALGHAVLEQALVPIALFEGAAKGANGNGYQPVKGVLEVLPSGPVPPDPGEFVGTAELDRILDRLRRHADIVLIDSPPVLNVGDALTLSTKVDGILLATRMKVVRRNMLHELARQLAGVPTRVLGFVVTDAGEEVSYGYGYGYGYEHGYTYSSRTPEMAGEAQARRES